LVLSLLFNSAFSFAVKQLTCAQLFLDMPQLIAAVAVYDAASFSSSGRGDHVSPQQILYI
jgi:hypothetical protein